MNPKLIIIKEVSLAEGAVGMEKNNIAIFIDIAPFEMPVELVLSI